MTISSSGYVNCLAAEMEPAIKDFHHPYKPYDIQTELMNVVYQCIAEGKIGILESPTGIPFLESAYDLSNFRL